ncbi:MAG: hypothetical protein JNJ83_04800, partial [Verrucomicrobiaceae bacterium]|nr:hypothetical protein [Verrucomicrobiaceae bacterium]
MNAPEPRNEEPGTSAGAVSGITRSKSLLPAFRRFSRQAWLLHGYLIASLILLPVSNFSYGQEADPPPEESGAPTPDPDPALTPEDPPPAEEPPPPPDPALTDSDGDLLSNATEAELGSDPYNPDSDYDGVTDADEVQITGTSPTNEDTDGDGVSDFNEFYGNYTVDTDTAGEGSTPYDWDGDGLEDPTDPDP